MSLTHVVLCAAFCSFCRYDSWSPCKQLAVLGRKWDNELERAAVQTTRNSCVRVLCINASRNGRDPTQRGGCHGPCLGLIAIASYFSVASPDCFCREVSLRPGAPSQGKTIRVAQVTTSPAAATEPRAPSLALFPAACEPGRPPLFPLAPPGPAWPVENILRRRTETQTGGSGKRTL